MSALADVTAQGASPSRLVDHVTIKAVKTGFFRQFACSAQLRLRETWVDRTVFGHFQVKID